MENYYSRRMAEQTSAAIGRASFTRPRLEKRTEKMERRETPPPESHRRHARDNLFPAHRRFCKTRYRCIDKRVGVCVIGITLKGSRPTGYD